MIRAVLDTNVIVAGLRSRNGASFGVLSQVAERRVRPLMTIALFLEYEAVLNRPEQTEAHGFSSREIAGFLSEFAALAEPVDLHFLWRPQLGDPADELVFGAAINGRSDCLITYNVGDFSRAASRFGLKVTTPGMFLKELER